MIASSDLDKAEVLKTYFFGVFTKEDHTNIPTLYIYIYSIYIA